MRAPTRMRVFARVCVPVFYARMRGFSRMRAFAQGSSRVCSLACVHARYVCIRVRVRANMGACMHMFFRGCAIVPGY